MNAKTVLPHERLDGLSAAKRELLRRAQQREATVGHEIVALALKHLGITHVYGIPGQPLYETFGAIARSGIRVIGTRHQQAAALMAVAHNYFSGSQRAALITSAGAPATNALTGVLVASDNCWPLLMIGGSAPRNMADKGYFMALDGPSIFRPVTKMVSTARTPEDIPKLLFRAYSVAQEGRPGPVYVDLPEDVVGGTLQRPPFPDKSTHMPLLPSAGEAGKALELLRQARRPLAILGKGLRWNASLESLKDLIEGGQVPFITSPIGRGVLPDAHPLCMNKISWRALSQADLILVLGARLDWTFRYGTSIRTDAVLIHVDIEPGELGRNREAQLAVNADLGAFIGELSALFDLNAKNAHLKSRDDQWLSALILERGVEERALAQQTSTDAVPISPYRLAQEIQGFLPPDALLVLDGNSTMKICEKVISAQHPHSRLTAGSNGCMGVGIPYAIAAKLSCPDRPVVTVCGDFAFGINAMEMESAVRYGVPILVVIANNDGNLGELRQRMHFPADHPDRVAMFQPDLHYEQMMRMFGGHGEYVDQPSMLRPALERALASGKPACVNVKIDPRAIPARPWIREPANED